LASTKILEQWKKYFQVLICSSWTKSFASEFFNLTCHDRSPIFPTPFLAKITCFGKSVRDVEIMSAEVGQGFRVGPGSGLSLSKCSGRFRACKEFFFNEGHFCCQLLLKQSSWLNLQRKMNNWELFSHVYFSTSQISRSCAYLHSFGTFGFRAKIGFQNLNFGLEPGLGFKMKLVYNSACWCVAPLATTQRTRCLFTDVLILMINQSKYIQTARIRQHGFHSKCFGGSKAIKSKFFLIFRKMTLTIKLYLF